MRATVICYLCIYFWGRDSASRSASAQDDKGTCQLGSSSCIDTDDLRSLYSELASSADILRFSQWNFSLPGILYESFPIDKETKNYVRQVRGAVFSSVKPTPFTSACRLAAVSDDALRNVLDIDPSTVWNDPFLDFASGNRILAGSNPLSHRYGGHQFGSWAGQLGDGRAVLLGEYQNRKGEHWELHLKGAGPTPYSRHGDGRAVLRSSVREFLASEAMGHLGIPTSRAASLVICDDQVMRAELEESPPKLEKTAAVIRLAKSWFRIGSLEILSERGEIDLLRSVVDFVIENYYYHVKQSNETYLAFFETVVKETAEMIAKWMSVGFAHGVCNTDNFSLLSITIDYGPYGFMDTYNPKYIPNTSDDEGRYSYENQPEVGFFNLNKLHVAMAPLLPDDDRSNQSLYRYPQIYRSKYLSLLSQKLGLEGSDENDERLLDKLLKMMLATEADFTMTFRELSEITLSDLTKQTFPEEFWSLPKLLQHQDWSNWLKEYIARLIKGGSYSDSTRQKRMQGVNPRYVLRNYLAQRAITQAENGRYSELSLLLTVLEKPFERQEIADARDFARRPPAWASKLKVSCSS